MNDSIETETETGGPPARAAGTVRTHPSLSPEDVPP